MARKIRKQLCRAVRGGVILGLGANIPGRWGGPIETLRRAIQEMGARGIRVHSISSFYASEPLGPVAQPNYVNAVVATTTSLPASALIDRLKAMEAEAGRQKVVRWGPRSLDIDIVDYKALIIAPDPGQVSSRYQLNVPHKELHKRDFVLLPLSEIMPRWHHPRTGLTPSQIRKLRPSTDLGLRKIEK